MKEFIFDKITNTLFKFVKISDFLRHRNAVQLGLMTVYIGWLFLQLTLPRKEWPQP